MSRDSDQIEVSPGGTAGEYVAKRGDAVSRLYAVTTAGKVWVFQDGSVVEITGEDGGRQRTPHAHGSLTAPMPATVVSINVAPGDRVKRGDVLIVLEAMKMELPVRSPGEGTVTAVHCAAGELVQPDVSLIDLE